MKRGEKIGILAAVFAGLIALSIDSQLSLFAESIRGFIPDFFFIGFAFEMQVFIVLFFLTSLFLFSEHKRRWILPLWLAAAASIAASYAIKEVVARPRPFETGIVSVLAVAYHLLDGGWFAGWNASFPSFQAVLAFSALPILDKEFRKMKWAWFAIACLIAFSRVYFGLHYASDVIFGAVIGYLLGYFAVRLEERYEFGKAAVRKLGA